jgi:hypothetical protein
MAVVIPIVTTFGSKGIQNAIKQFKTLNNNMDRARFLSQRLLLPATAALAAGTGVLAKQLFDAARAAAQDEAAQKQLRLALINSTGATDEQIIGVEQLIDKMARATGVADDQLRPAMGTLARATGDLTIAQQLLKLALDISAATGKPVEDVTNALGLAYLGNTKALKALGIETKNADGSTKSFKEIQEELTKLFSGAAATSANTFEGKLARLKVAFDEIKERIGKAILPYLEKFADFTLNALVPAVEKFIDSMVGGKGFKASFQQAIAATGPFSTAMVEAMKTVTLAVLELIKQLVVAYELFKALQAAAKAAAGGWKAAIPDIAAVLAAAVVAQSLDALKNSAVDYFDQLKAGIPAIQAAQAAQQGLGTATAAVPDRLDRLEASLAKTTTGLNGMGNAANGVTDKVKAAADAIRDRMNRALDDAKTKLADAQNAFNDFRDNVSGAINGVVNFGDAARTSAERGGVTFFDALEEQANKAKEFGNLVDRLLAAGLSKEALQQVIDAGQEAGSFIAKQLLESSENILRANKLVEETTKIAQAIGNAAATKFYQAGITNGQAYLKGVEEAIAAAEARLARKGIKVADVKGIGASFDDSLARLNQPVTPTGTNVAPSNTSVVVNTVTAPSNLGDIIVNALQDYNRRSGPLQLQIE